MGTGKDVRLLKEKYPGVPVVSYVNTSAEVKAETDVCCTSANAVKIVKSLGVKRVIFLPDDYLAKYVASQTDVEIISWKGICIVHDQFNKKEIEDIRKNNPGIKIIAHPECPPDVIEASDFAGSTSGMIKYVKDNQPKKVMMVTECSMSDNIQIENPNVDFVKPCNMCPHMKKIIKSTVKLALNGDLYPSGDITSSLIKDDKIVTVKLIANQSAIVAGLLFAKQTFSLIDDKIKFIIKKKDGSRIKKGNLVALIKGNAKNILIAERVALNFLSHISGIATKTNKFVKLAGKKAKICCTRKTIPNLRVIQKYAVKLGGGTNHRFNLSDEYLIKDNHIASSDLKTLVSLAIKNKKGKKI